MWHAALDGDADKVEESIRNGANINAATDLVSRHPSHRPLLYWLSIQLIIKLIDDLLTSVIERIKIILINRIRSFAYVTLDHDLHRLENQHFSMLMS